MASIRLFHSQIEAGRLPNVCLCCGAPATLRRRHRFSRAPFSRIMTAGHYLSGTTLSHIRGLQKRAFAVPLCEQHRHRLSLPLHVMLGGFALFFLCGASLVVGGCGGVFVSGLAWLLLVAAMCFVGMIVVAIAFCVVRMKTPQYSDITDQYIELNCVSDQFAAAAQSCGGQRTDAASLGEGLTKGYLLYGIASGAAALCVLGVMIVVVLGAFGAMAARSGNPPAAAAANRQAVDPRPNEPRPDQPAGGRRIVVQRSFTVRPQKDKAPDANEASPAVPPHTPLLRLDFEPDGYATEGTRLLVLDRSGRDFHGTLKGAAQPSLVAGRIGEALALDGKDDLIVIPRLREQLVAGATELTLAAWVRIEKPSGVGFVFDVGYHGGSEVALYHREDEIKFALAAGHGGATLSAPRRKTTEWQHLAGVWDGRQLHFYIDGQAVASQPTSIAALDGKSIGRDPAHVGTTAKSFRRSGRFFHGAIDELLLLPRALSDAEIQDLYQRGQATSPTPTFETP